MPAWSPQIADVFVRLGRADRKGFDQLQLQRLVYIAHGVCLATIGQPLTGDRPEAWNSGPIYRRLAEALAPNGRSLIGASDHEREKNRGQEWATKASTSDLDEVELDIIVDVYQNYSDLSTYEMSALTRGRSAPWAGVFANGRGLFRDIPHRMIRDQFVEFVAQSPEDPQTQ